MKENNQNSNDLWLLVEDEESIATPLSKMLSRKGYKVEWVSNGEEALEWLKTKPKQPIGILLDIMMPKMDGWEFRKQQLSLSAPLRDIPVIILSADNQSERKAKSDLERFVAKPIDLNLLYSTMRELSQIRTPN